MPEGRLIAMDRSGPARISYISDYLQCRSSQATGYTIAVSGGQLVAEKFSRPVDVFADDARPVPSEVPRDGRRSYPRAVSGVF